MCYTVYTRQSMVLTVDIMHESAPINKMHPRLQSKKNKVKVKSSSKRHYTFCTLLARWSALGVLYGL